MAITRIKNNQITDSSTGNIYLGINAAVKLQDYSITAGKIANSLVYGSDLTVSGNLTVNGTTTTIDTVSVVIEDPILLLAANQTGSPSLDIGFIGERGTSQNIAFVWDESAGEFVTVYTNDTTTNTTVTISSYANFHTNDANIGGNLTVNGTTTLIGNIGLANISASGQISATGNITGGNVVSNAAVSAATTVDATGNITGGNLLSNASISAATTVSATGNITGGNLVSNAAISAATTISGTGNITGGNLLSNASISAATTISGTGNITGGNLISNAAIEASGLISAGTTISATGNITGGNVISNALIFGATLETSGNALIGGNLTVQGNLTYINIDDLRVEDPVIIMGTGPNGAPLTTDDGMDRGIYMEYYKGAVGNASVFWDNSTGNLVAATSVNFSANNIINVLQYGTFQAGNVWAQTLNAPALNVTNINATGNITGGNVIANSGVFATTGYFTGNVDILGTLTATSNVIANTSGIFYGNTVTGNGAIFGGVPGFTPLASNVVIQFAGNANSYSQVNFENVNPGSAASTDYIATANNGDDSTYFIDMGITSNNHTGVHDAFFTEITTNNTGYLYIVASDETGPGSSGVGNLILGSSNGNVLTFVGNTGFANVRTVASTEGFDITNGNLYVSNITSRGSRITVNNGLGDIDFAVNGDTNANVFYIDAGTETASFGNSTQVTGALVSFQSSGAILIPRGNTATRPGTGVTGMIRFNTTTDNLEFYDADSWVSAGTVFTVIDSEVFNGDGSTVVYTLNSQQTTDSCIVSINGVLQIPVLAYSVSGNVLTFTEAPLVSDTIEVRQITTTTTIKGISNSNGNAAVEVVDTDNDVRITGDLIPTSNVSQNLGSPALQWNDLYLSGNSIYIGDVILKAGSGNLQVRNFDDTADAGITGTFYTTSTTSGNLQIGFNHIEATNVNGNIELRPNGTGLVVVGTSAVTKLQVGNIQIADAGSNTVIFYRADGTTPATISSLNIDSTLIANGTANVRTFSNADVTTSAGGNANVLVVSNGSITVKGNILNGQANGVGNIGNSTTYFNTAFVKATSAQYADLAEMYRADQHIAPGTVVMFGGSAEVTVCANDACRRVAGVISTNPSYIMNSSLEGDHVVAVALTGRVPTRVTGTVRKGDMMVSAGDGSARAEAEPRVGTVIGKALEDFDGVTGVIEIVVGRL